MKLYKENRVYWVNFHGVRFAMEWDEKNKVWLDANNKAYSSAEVKEIGKMIGKIKYC